MRKPFGIEYEGGTNLKKVINLIVLHENIEFQFEKYYTGGNFGDTIIYSDVNVTYLVRSGKLESFNFSFIAPSAEGTGIKINGNECVHNAILTEGDTGKKYYPWTDKNNILYNINFQGKLNEGDNEISVYYRQPLCLRETSMGCCLKMSSSTWEVSAPYEFAPIKEWILDKNFSADITLSVPYDYWIMDSVFGPDIDLNCHLFMGNEERIDLQQGKIIHKDNYLIRNFRIKDTLPDYFLVSVSEN